MLKSVNVTDGLKEEGALLINSEKEIEKLKEDLNGYKGRVFKIAASKISKDLLGANFPNTSLLAAIVKITNIMTKDELLCNMEESFKHKFARKPEVILPNMEAIKLAYNEVKGGF
ncbi:pyruvate synthase subunit porC [Clostridium sp. CAG:921]|nr:pyruvate synthase subunit porC [Clostridium sp. CAG:921]